MLDDMAQGSRDSLLTLLDINTERDVWWTLHTNKDAHRLLEMLQFYYRKKLEERRIHSTEGVTIHYDSVRLSILQAIVADTPQGYRDSDARFLIGSIYWRHGRVEDAVRWWSELTIDPANAYASPSQAVLDAVRGRHWQSVDPKPIDQILDSERGRWRDFWWGRLKQFGYSFSRF